jgi:hypothetical protein
MTEFVVVASLVLVPAFLLLPMIGKLVTMKQATIQAARYMAWESTAWNSGNSTPKMLQTFHAVQPPVRSASRLGKETARRVFSDSTLAISAKDASLGWNLNTDNPVWSKPNGQPLYVYGKDTATSYKNSDLPTVGGANPTVALSGVDSIMSTVVSYAGKLLDLKSPAKFDAVQSGGYVSTSVAMPVLKVTNLAPFDKLNLVFHANAALVTRGWNAGGYAQTGSEVRGLVPTVLFDNPLLNFVRNNPIVKVVAPDISSSNLKFGYVDTEAMPPAYLDGGSGSTSCDNKTGLCAW